ncbi:hypothetical protein Tco_1221843 [Tanacetum coccineum]
MLEKSMYDSWASHIRLFIKGKKNDRMMLDSIDNGPLVYPNVEENRQTRPKKYSELTEAQQLQDDCDVQATNIILHGLPPYVYALVNHQEAAKDIWDKVKLLMKGTELLYQEHKCRLYNLFDKFTSVQEWIKFVTDVKLAKSLYTTNYNQLYAYLSQHERHANEVHIMHERYPDPLALATIQDGRVTVQQFQGRQTQSFAGTGNRGIPITSRGNYAAGQAKIIPQNLAFQTENLDAYDLDCDDISSAKVVLMKNISSCNSDVLSEESQDAGYQDTNSSTPNDLLVLSLVEQMTDHVANLAKEN